MIRLRFIASFCLIPILVIAIPLVNSPASAASGEGYYRHPTIYNETIVFTSEGDLWKVSAHGGVATRLTTHADAETDARISPNGKSIAFTARYEGPAEIYVMPLAGGLPKRVTYTSENCYVAGWTPSGKLMYSTRQYSTLPRYQLVVHDLVNGEERLLPLSQARYGAYNASGKTLFFTRFPFQGSWAKRYKGGTAQNVWRYSEGDEEATLLTGDYTGTSKEPVWHDGRVYFISDRDGTMNLWSMTEDGSDKKQLTAHDGWDVQSASISNGRIVYHAGADLYLFDIQTQTGKKLEITLISDFDQKREKWVEKPMDYLTSAHLSADGSKIALTARGQIFVAPAEKGRFVRVTRKESVRYRNAVFSPDGKSVLALSDESGELEFYKMPANGVGQPEQLTDNGSVLRWSGIPSHDSKMIAYDDKDLQLWIFNVETGDHTLVGLSSTYGYTDFSFSPDNKWLVYSTAADNFFSQVFVYDISNKTSHEITSDRFHSFSPVWSPDGEWLYFISDRNYKTIYGSVWGTRQQEPFFDKTTELYMLPLAEARRSPFLVDDELSSVENKDENKKGDKDKDEDKKESDDPVKVTINFKDIEKRLIRVPVPAGEYSSLSANAEIMAWISQPRTGERLKTLQAVKLDDTKAEVVIILSKPDSYQMSADGKKLLVRKGSDLSVFDAKAAEMSDLSDHHVDLSGWTVNLNPTLEWRQMFTEAWRLHRDYFYDPDLHGLDWSAILEKYVVFVHRVSDRYELSNLLGQMVSELETMHTAVRGGDFRDGEDDVGIAALGARLLRDSETGGYRIDHIYQFDPEYPDELSPLARADLDLEEGDIILAVNGVELSSVSSIGESLRKQVDRQVLLGIRDKSSNERRDVVVTPLSSRGESNLRYNEWEYTRRLIVEGNSDNQIGYVHLRNTVTNEFGRWARDFYPVFNRDGLIIDNRHNGGGNIDPWMVSRLMRKAWSYWEPRKGIPQSNQQYAFLGHVVVLCNEHTGSDGELFSEGLRRMIGAKIIGVRSWGGEVWLTSSNKLVDKGIATAAEYGVYGANGEWLIEGHGVVPDIVVENLPRATFDGKDAQLEAAIEYLKKQIAEEPIVRPKAPPYPARAKKK